METVEVNLLPLSDDSPENAYNDLNTGPVYNDLYPTSEHYTHMTLDDDPVYAELGNEQPAGNHGNEETVQDSQNEPTACYASINVRRKKENPYCEIPEVGVEPIVYAQVNKKK